jgi:biopolymer transport protein ExbD
MKLPRNSKLLRSPFDAAPFAAVFFLLVIFLVLSALLPTPGLELNLQLPVASNLPGTDKPTVAMAVDADGRFYFDNQIVSRETLSDRLHTATHGGSESLTLLIHADKRVTYETLVDITLLARDAGISNALLATLPGENGSARPKP